MVGSSSAGASALPDCTSWGDDQGEAYCPATTGAAWRTDAAASLGAPPWVAAVVGAAVGAAVVAELVADAVAAASF